MVRSSKLRAPKSGSGVIASPNIWHWPEVYEEENRAQDPRGAVYAALREAADWTGRDVVDIVSGFHLPMFAADARTVTGIEPHPPLVAAARTRVDGLPSVTVTEGSAAHMPLPDASVDLVHARTAYFFGPGCGAGTPRGDGVWLRPGVALAVVDLDATAHPYGDWMRDDLPHYNPAASRRSSRRRDSICAASTRCGSFRTERPSSGCSASSSHHASRPGRSARHPARRSPSATGCTCAADPWAWN